MTYFIYYSVASTNLLFKTFSWYNSSKCGRFSSISSIIIWANATGSSFTWKQAPTLSFNPPHNNSTALSDPVTPWLIEIVAGIIDKGESTVQTAIREAKEEIGVNISENDLFCFKTVYPSPGCITEKVTLYVAKTDLSHLGNHGGLESECEDIRVFKAKLSDAYEQVLHGRINNSIAMIGILYLMHNKEEVLKHFAKWSSL